MSWISITLTTVYKTCDMGPAVRLRNCPLSSVYSFRTLTVWIDKLPELLTRNMVPRKVWTHKRTQTSYTTSIREDLLQFGTVLSISTINTFNLTRKTNFGEGLKEDHRYTPSSITMLYFFMVQHPYVN